MPRSAARPSFSALLDVPITCAPASWASCTAAEPMPLETEFTSTVSADPQAAAREEHVPRRAERDLERPGVLVGDLVGDAHELLRRAGHVLREPARPRDAEEDARRRAGTA